MTFQALFPAMSVKHSLVDRLTVRALAYGVGHWQDTPETDAADEFVAIAEGDDLPLVLALQRIQRGQPPQDDIGVVERAARILHLALARRSFGGCDRDGQRAPLGQQCARALSPV